MVDAQHYFIFRNWIINPASTFPEECLQPKKVLVHYKNKAVLRLQLSNDTPTTNSKLLTQV